MQSKPQRPGHTTWLLLGMGLLLVGMPVLLFHSGVFGPGRLSPESHTSTSIWGLKRRIHIYAQDNDALPQRTADLPPLEGFYNSATDAWGNEIEMILDGTKVTLASYGKDAKPGGTGDNLDIIGVFETKTADGQWIDQNEGRWELRPLIGKQTLPVTTDTGRGQ